MRNANPPEMWGMPLYIERAHVYGRESLANQLSSILATCGASWNHIYTCIAALINGELCIIFWHQLRFVYFWQIALIKRAAYSVAIP